MFSRATVSQTGSWTVPADEVDAPAVPTPGGAEAGTGAFNAVTCATSDDCVAVGGDANLGGIAATSSDGGNTWTSASVESGQPELNAVTCSGISDCVAVGVGDAATSSTAALRGHLSPSLRQIRRCWESVVPPHRSVSPSASRQSKRDRTQGICWSRPTVDQPGLSLSFLRT